MPMAQTDAGARASNNRGILLLALPLLVVGLSDLALASGFERRAAGFILVTTGALALILANSYFPESGVGKVLAGSILSVVYVIACISATRADGRMSSALVVGILGLGALILTVRMRPWDMDLSDLVGHFRPVGAAIGALIGLLVLFLSQFYIPTRSPPTLSADLSVTAAEASDGLIPLKVTVDATNQGTSPVWVIGSLAEVAVAEVGERPIPTETNDLEASLARQEVAGIYARVENERLVAFDEPFAMGSWFEPGETITKTFAAYVPQHIGNHVTVRVVTFVIPQRRLSFDPSIVENELTDSQDPTGSKVWSRTASSVQRSLWERALKVPTAVVAEIFVSESGDCGEPLRQLADQPVRACLAMGFWPSSNSGEDVAVSESLRTYFGSVGFPVSYSADLASLAGGDG